MKATIAFAKRNTKEILRDMLSLFFGIGFPVVLLLLLTLIQSNIPVSLFELKRLTPGIAFFGLSFLALFSATLISKDRSSSLMTRLCVSPMSAWGYILGYTLPLIPMAIVQMLTTFIFAIILGLNFTPNIFLCVAVLIPSAILYIALGLLCGSLFNDKQVGGICGALLTNVSAFLSGIWFDVSLVGGTFKKVCECLPFIHSVEAGRCALNGDIQNIMSHLWWVIGYAIVLLVLAIITFNKKLKAK